MSNSKNIHRASKDGDWETVRELLAEGAKVDHIENGRFNSTPLQEAAFHGHLAVVRALIEAGANVNHVDNDNFTPVNSAAAQGKWEVVKFLVWEGADFQAADATGRSAEDYLRRCRSARVKAEVQAVVDACRQNAYRPANLPDPSPARPAGESG